MKKLLNGVLIFLFSLLFVSCGEKKVEEEKTTFKSVETIEVKKGKIEKNSISAGVLEAINEVEEFAKTSANVIKINYKNGEKVNKGDVILVLENKDIESLYLDTKARLLSAQADYNVKKTSFDKYATLYEENLISENDYLNQKNMLASSKANLESVKASLIKTEKNFRDLTVKSKIKGKVANLDLKLHQKVDDKSALFKIVDNDELRISSGVSSSDVTTLKEGALAQIYVEDIKDYETGILYEINPVANETTRKFDVKIKLENKEDKYKQGMYARVILNTGEKQGILVPKKAIIIDGLYSYIFIAVPSKIEVEDGKTEDGIVAKRIRVDLGLVNGEYQEIENSQLNNKFKVVVVGQYSLSDGDYLKEMAQGQEG